MLPSNGYFTLNPNIVPHDASKRFVGTECQAQSADEGHVSHSGVDIGDSVMPLSVGNGHLTQFCSHYVDDDVKSRRAAVRDQSGTTSWIAAPLNTWRRG
jgi:hypothetical protein